MTQEFDRNSSTSRYEVTNAISIKDVSKTFGTFTALDMINLDVKEGEIFGLLGPNGAGKTTTMRILSCLIRPTSGSVLVEGMNVLDKEKTVEIRKRIGLLTENPNIYERLTAEQNLRFFAKAYGLSESLTEQRITEILRGFDLLDRRKDKAGTFSKGMKQKLAIARALIHKPSLLLLDEPTSALDAESAKSIRELILETAQKYKHTVMLSTHNLDDASRLCDRIAILNKGQILTKGTENEIASEIRGSSDLFEVSLNSNKLRVELMELGAFSVQKLLANVSGITDVRSYMNSHQGYEFSIDPKLSELEVDMLVSKVTSFIVGLGGEITLVQQIKPSLEDMYMQIISMSRNSTR
ncbi:MAG: ABC transporter ATP-binding protein [archaeon]|nr:ABC transporter ATP-binding protein [archaeon]